MNMLVAVQALRLEFRIINDFVKGLAAVVRWGHQLQMNKENTIRYLSRTESFDMKKEKCSFYRNFKYAINMFELNQETLISWSTYQLKRFLKTSLGALSLILDS